MIWVQPNRWSEKVMEGQLELKTLGKTTTFEVGLGPILFERSIESPPAWPEDGEPCPYLITAISTKTDYIFKSPDPTAQQCTGGLLLGHRQQTPALP
jgi:hypothetical protein